MMVMPSRSNHAFPASCFLYLETASRVAYWPEFLPGDWEGVPVLHQQFGINRLIPETIEQARSSFPSWQTSLSGCGMRYGSTRLVRHKSAGPYFPNPMQCATKGGCTPHPRRPRPQGIRDRKPAIGEFRGSTYFYSQALLS